jgi:threonine aldolase
MMPLPLQETLQAAGARFYPWTTNSLPKDIPVSRNAALIRLVTSFQTTAREVDDFVAAAAGGR